jgi:hypothetical protein
VRWFVDSWGVRPWVIIVSALMVVVSFAWGAWHLFASDQRDCIDYCVRAKVEETREKCVFRCAWGRNQ